MFLELRLQNIKQKKQLTKLLKEKKLKLIHLMTHRSGYGYYGNPQWFTSTVKYENLVCIDF